MCHFLSVLFLPRVKFHSLFIHILVGWLVSALFVRFHVCECVCVSVCLSVCTLVNDLTHNVSDLLLLHCSIPTGRWTWTCPYARLNDSEGMSPQLPDDCRQPRTVHRSQARQLQEHKLNLLMTGTNTDQFTVVVWFFLQPVSYRRNWVYWFVCCDCVMRKMFQQG